jgi:hypothetical protein
MPALASRNAVIVMGVSNPSVEGDDPSALMTSKDESLTVIGPFD